VLCGTSARLERNVAEKKSCAVDTMTGHFSELKRQLLESEPSAAMLRRELDSKEVLAIYAEEI
jgi:hypothetical protein